MKNEIKSDSEHLKRGSGQATIFNLPFRGEFNTEWGCTTACSLPWVQEQDFLHTSGRRMVWVRLPSSPRLYFKTYEGDIAQYRRDMFARGSSHIRLITLSREVSSLEVHEACEKLRAEQGFDPNMPSDEQLDLMYNHAMENS